MTNLPKHLQESLKRYEEKLAKFNLKPVDLSEENKKRFDDFHPIHAMI